MKKKILITGLPGVGKTTLVLKLAKGLRDFFPVGFFTSEIREKGIRKGFSIESFDGGKSILAHINIESLHRVGKYNVDVQGLELFLDGIPFLSEKSEIIVIDEIGKMECFSEKFKMIVEQILASEKIIIATIALKGNQWIEMIKSRDDVILFELNRSNCKIVEKDIIALLAKQGIAVNQMFESM